jgi:hypothetical protein
VCSLSAAFFDVLSQLVHLLTASGAFFVGVVGTVGYPLPTRGLKILQHGKDAWADGDLLGAGWPRRLKVSHALIEVSSRRHHFGIGASVIAYLQCLFILILRPVGASRRRSLA